MTGESHPLGGQNIEIGGSDFLLAEAAKVAVAEVVGQNENDVWWSRTGCRAIGRSIICGSRNAGTQSRGQQTGKANQYQASHE